MVDFMGAPEPLLWQGREPPLCPESSSCNPLHLGLGRCPSWKREATSNSASSMCCPSRWESWKEKYVMSRRSWEMGSSVLENRMAGMSWSEGGRGWGLGFLDRGSSRELGF